MHVPFAIRAPFARAQHRVVTDPVRSVDDMPTALDLLGVAPPASLAPLMTGATERPNASVASVAGYAEAMYPLHHYGWSELTALRSGRYKVIDAPRPELYDEERDPGESTNLYADRRQLADRLIAELRRLESGFTQAKASLPAGDVDPEARQRLAALGYVGSFVATASDSRTGRADPKDKIAIFNKLGEATELTKDRDASGKPPFDRIVGLLNEIVRDDPEVIDAWFMLGMQHMQHGDLDKAVGYFKHTLTLKPDYDLAVFNLAQAYRRMGNDEAALAGFEHYVTLDAKDPFAYYQMGEIWLDRGDTARAEGLFRHALEIDPQTAAAKNALGVIALQRGDPATAERLIREALAVKSTLRLAHFNLALIAEQRGDLAAAQSEYTRELELHPGNYKAAFNLGKLYEAARRPAEQEAAFRKAIEANPEFGEGYFYLAKLYLDQGRRLDEAITLAQKGLEVAPRSPYAPLGHYVLADLYSRLGRRADAVAEAQRGRALEARGGG